VVVKDGYYVFIVGDRFHYSRSAKIRLIYEALIFLRIIELFLYEPFFLGESMYACSSKPLLVLLTNNRSVHHKIACKKYDFSLI
jgi:hypothetical protein